MKKKSTLTTYRSFILTSSLLFIIAALTACSVVENVPGTETKNAEEISKKAKVTHKDYSVKIYPDLVKRMIHVKSTETRQLDFYVFDTEGTMVVHYKMKEKEHKKISGLKRGAYVYQVFGGDEMTSSGKIIIK